MFSFTVRIVNGSTKYEGRVEVYHNGEWGTVCDDGWDLNDAQVVCNELGFANASDATLGSIYRQGCLNNLQCTGMEETVGKCLHSGWLKYSLWLGHYTKEAVVKCIRGNNFLINVYLLTS